METKLKTFLTVCDTMNYHAAAAQLHLTQPAVTKQIQALEAQYQTRLFQYDGKRLSKTDACQILEQYARSIQYNYEEMEQAITGRKRFHLRIGATKTIGDYVLPDSIAQYVSAPDHEMTLIVDNTSRLLSMLDANELDFLVVEGLFDKKRYDWHTFRTEPFIGICAPDHPFSGRAVSMEELLKETLIVREPGSGTRDILERHLNLCGYGPNALCKPLTLSSFSVIRELVNKQLGSSFLYQSVVGDDPAFGRFQAPPLTGEHAFYVVYLKHTHAGQYAHAFFSG